MESYLWAELQDQPLMPPPPGRVPNFLHPESRAWQINVATGICLPLIALFAAMRFYAKAAILKKWTWDDVTCTLGVLAGLVYFIVALIVANGGVYGKHLWELTIRDFSPHNIKLLFVFQFMNGPCIWFVKLSLFVLYVQVFHPLRWLRYCAYAGAISTGLLYWTFPIVSHIMCTPRDGTSQEDYLMASSAPSCHKSSYLGTGITLGIVSLVSDLYLVILPMPAVWKLQMPLDRKLSLSAMFFTGAIACICSAFALAYRVEMMTNQDTTWTFVPLGVVTNVEFTAGILVCCMPTTTAVFKQLRGPVSSVASSYRRKFRSKSGSGTTDRYNLSSVTNLHPTDEGDFYTINGEATHEAFARKGSGEKRSESSLECGNDSPPGRTNANIRKTTDIEVRRL